MVAVLGWAEVLMQDEVWVNGQALEDLDVHHRANLIPFLRGNKRRLYLVSHPGAVLRDATPAAAEEWLVTTPLMRRLVELEQGRALDDRRATAERNAAHEKATGYQKIREACPICNGVGLVRASGIGHDDDPWLLDCRQCGGTGETT